MRCFEIAVRQHRFAGCAFKATGAPQALPGLASGPAVQWNGRRQACHRPRRTMSIGVPCAST